MPIINLNPVLFGGIAGSGHIQSSAPSAQAGRSMSYADFPATAPSIDISMTPTGDPLFDLITGRITLPLIGVDM